MSTTRTEITTKRRPLLGERTTSDLMLSTANPPSGTRKHPERLSFFRAKPGADGQWGAAARAFNKFYGCEIDAAGNAKSGPKMVPIRFPFRTLSEALEVRYLGFAAGRLAAIGDTNYTAVPAHQQHAPEWLTVIPLEGESVRVQIDGEDDPFCLGGQYDVPIDKQAQATIKRRATLHFTCAEVGSLLAITSYQTSGFKAIDSLWGGLRRLEALGPLGQWLCMLRLRPAKQRYRDAQGKAHSSQIWIPEIYGPVHALDDRRAITLPDAYAQLERAQGLGLLGTAPLALPPSPVASAPAPLPLELGTWSPDGDEELVPSEVIPPPDDGGEF
jgi:hypothetical protein